VNLTGEVTVKKTAARKDEGRISYGQKSVISGGRAKPRRNDAKSKLKSVSYQDGFLQLLGRAEGTFLLALMWMASRWRGCGPMRAARCAPAGCRDPTIRMPFALLQMLGAPADQVVQNGLARRKQLPRPRHAQASGQQLCQRKHELSKKIAEAILKRPGRPDHQASEEGRNASVSSVSASCRCASAPPAWAATPPPAKAIHIKASKKVAFRAAKELKEAV